MIIIILFRNAAGLLDFLAAADGLGSIVSTSSCRNAVAGRSEGGSGMNVNLKLMHIFLLVAEHNSFCRAAEVSNRSQSAVSKQIRQLELQLGVSLFHRTTRRVQLTREGELLLVCARRAVSELQTGLRQIKEAADIQRGGLSAPPAHRLWRPRACPRSWWPSRKAIPVSRRDCASLPLRKCLIASAGRKLILA